MSTLYRAIWATRSGETIERADEEFVAWAEERAERAHRPLAPRGVRVRASEGRRFVLSRDEYWDLTDTKIARALRVALVETSTDGVRRETTLRAWRGGSVEGEGAAGWVWVDVDAVSHDATPQLPEAPPEFVATLLGLTAAVRGDVSLAPVPRRFAGEAGAEELGELLTLQGRDVPVVVFGGLPARSPKADVRTLGTAVAQTVHDVAGYAVVAALDAAGLVSLPGVLGEEYGLRSAAMRVYLPELDPADGGGEAHVEIDPERWFGRPGMAGHLAVNYLAGRATCRRAPNSWDHAERRLGEQVPQGSADRLHGLEERIRELEQLLEDERAASDSVLDDAAEREDEVVELTERLETAARDIRALRSDRTVRGLEALEDLVRDVRPRDCGDAVALARRYLVQFLVLPDDVGDHLELLDRQRAGGTWGRRMWRALRALALYARDARGDFHGDFRQWCLESGHPMAWSASPKSLAMRESTTVEARWREERTFTVDGEQLYVPAHIKISSAGTVAPRLHFLWRPKQGVVHVPYIGPHLRNTKT